MVVDAGPPCPASGVFLAHPASLFLFRLVRTRTASRPDEAMGPLQRGWPK